MSTLAGGHQLQLLEGGGEFFPALTAAIDQARREVRLETYIFDFEGAGTGVALALERAATRGVAVFLVMDGVGTPRLPAQWVQRFDQAGVMWRIFSPLGGLGLLIPSRWRRLHRKLCVVDGLQAFCGGINVLDDLHDPNHGPLTAPRFDFAVCVSGPLVQDVHQALALFWTRMEVSRTVRQPDLQAAWQSLHEVVATEWKTHWHEKPVMSGSIPKGGARARAGLVLRDNVRNRTRIERSYRQAIGEARQEIIIANAYFLPGAKLRKALIHAAKRGVRVRLLLQGRYEYFMQYHAARPVYGALLAAGVEITEYATSFLHAKVAVIDGRWATVGSSNLDPLSLLLAREANVQVEDAAFAAALHLKLEQAMERDGHRVDPAEYANRPWQMRIRDRIAFALMRLALFLSGNRY
jgi:cardiolipin synthase A/B